MDSMVNRAREIAFAAHSGQVDKAGEPYYLHPFAVADMVDGREAKAAAYLHDVVEDSEITLDWLRQQGFPPSVIEAVDAITKRDGEDYHAYLARVKKCELALKVKLADISHNSDETRPGTTSQRLEKYRAARDILLKS